MHDWITTFSQLLLVLLFALLYAITVKKKSDAAIRATFLMMALIFLIRFLFNFDSSYLATGLILSLLFIQGPIIYWLIRSSVSLDKKPISSVHFIPVPLFALAVILHVPEILDISYAILFVTRAIYCTFSILLLYRERDYILKSPQKGWLFVLLVWAGLTSYAYLGYFTGYLFQVKVFGLAWAPTINMMQIINAMSAAMGLALVWWALYYDGVYAVADKNKHPATAFDKEVFSCLNVLFSKEEIFKDDDVDLAGVADLLAVTPRELSGAVNRTANITFPMFVRGYRVSAAKEMLANKDLANIPITEIGLDSGFANKSTFNISFKAITGISPRDFRAADKA